MLGRSFSLEDQKPAQEVSFSKRLFFARSSKTNYVLYIRCHSTTWRYLQLILAAIKIVGKGNLYSYAALSVKLTTVTLDMTQGAETMYVLLNDKNAL